MTIRIDRSIFDALANDAVGHACFEPMVPIYQAGMRGRNGKEAMEYRTEFYRTLTPGQRALFMYFTFYDHAIRSTDELLRISNHYLSANIFGAVKKGISYFHDDNMLDLISAIEQAVTGKDLSKISLLYHRLNEISSNSLAIIGAQIKENPAEFIDLIK